MKKINILLLITIIFILLGCSSGSSGFSPVDEYTVAQHAWINNWFYQTAHFFDMELDSFEILDRRTSTETRVDTAFVFLASSHNNFEFMGTSTLTYQLYDDGWHLHSVGTNSIYIIPVYDFRGHWATSIPIDDINLLNSGKVNSLNVYDTNWEDESISLSVNWNESDEYFLLYMSLIPMWGKDVIIWPLNDGLGGAIFTYSEYGFEVFTTVHRSFALDVSIDEIRNHRNTTQLFRQ